jgi:hypothetical protein
MKASNYLLESCRCPLPFWYSTLSQISDRTALEFNLLTAARSQVRINVVIRFFMFGGNATGLSVAIRYGDSKSYAPARNLVTYHWILFAMAFCCDYASEQDFEPNCPYGRFLFHSNVESFWLETWMIYRLVKPFRCCIWYHTFLLNPLKFDGIASSYFCIAPYHMHHLTSAFITLSKSASIWCNLECIWYNLVVIECFHWPLSDYYLLELYLEPHPLDLPCVSHVLLAIKEHLVCGANSLFQSHPISIW